MKVYNLSYTNKDNEGVATVTASNANDATLVLKEQGRLNATPYKITSIQEVGCNDSPVREILTDSFSEKKYEIVQTPVTSKFDINSLSKEDIKRLKLRINEYTGTLYVDRIGEGFRDKADDGHTILYRSPDPRSDHWRTGKVFTKINGEYIDLGRPTKYRYVESPKKRVKLIYGDNVYYETIETFSIKKYALFVKVPGKGFGKSSKERGHLRNRPAKWKFVQFYPKGIGIDESSIYNVIYSKDFLSKVFTDDDRNGYLFIDKAENLCHKIAIGEYTRVYRVDEGKKVYTLKLKGAPLNVLIVRKEY